MPSIYTHDCFGKEVSKFLPKDLKKLCIKYKKAFRIGLQGPDFLFFHHPFLKLETNRLGHKMHRTSARDILYVFLPAIIKAGRDSGEYAYLVGFICHFMLDSECHGYVNRKAEEKGYNHLVMEMEFDRYLLAKHGKNATTFPIYRLIPHDPKTIKTLAHMYAHFGRTEQQIAEALRGMYFFKKLFTTGKTLRRAVLRLGMVMTFQYRQLEGHMMNLTPKSNSSLTNPELLCLYQNAIPQAASLIREFHRYFPETIKNKRFRCDFKSNQISDL